MLSQLILALNWLLGDTVKFGLSLFKTPCPRPTLCFWAQHRINNAMSWKVILYSALWIAVRRSSCWLSYIRKPSGTYHLESWAWCDPVRTQNRARPTVVCWTCQSNTFVSIRDTCIIVVPIDKHSWKMAKSCHNGDVKSFFYAWFWFLRRRRNFFGVSTYLFFLSGWSKMQCNDFVYKKKSKHYTLHDHFNFLICSVKGPRMLHPLSHC